MATKNENLQHFRLCRKIKGSLEESKSVFLTSFQDQYKEFHPVNDLGLSLPTATTNNSSNSDENENKDITKAEKKMLLDSFLNEAFDEEIRRFEQTLHEPTSSTSESTSTSATESLTNKVEYFFEIMTCPLGESEQVVGYCSIQYDPNKYHYYIHQLALLPSHQGKGLGRLLVFPLLKDYFYHDGSKSFHPAPKDEKVPVSSISVLTRRINQKAIEFYEHLGFHEVSEVSETNDDYLDFTKYIQLEMAIK